MIRMLTKHVTVSPGIESALKEGLQARNVIVHRVLIDNVEMFTHPHTRAKLIKEIRVLRRKVRAADKAFSAFINAFSAVLDGVENEQIEKEVKAPSGQIPKPKALVWSSLRRRFQRWRCRLN